MEVKIKIKNENESIDKNDKNEEEESIENAQLIPERDFSIDKEEEKIFILYKCWR